MRPSGILPGPCRPQEEDEFAQAHKQKLTLDRDGLAREFAMNLQMFVDICRDRGITPVLMTQGNRITDYARSGGGDVHRPV